MNIIKVLRGNHFLLESPLPADECIQRLKVSVGKQWPVKDGKPVYGSVGKDNFVIIRRPKSKGPIRTAIIAAITEEGANTKLKCWSGVYGPSLFPYLTLFLFSCVLFSSLTSIALTYALPPWQLPSTNLLTSSFFGLGILGFTAAAIAMPNLFRRDSEQYLIEFLETTIDAKRA